MAWTIDGTDIQTNGYGPYDLQAPGDIAAGTRLDIQAFDILQGGSRTAITTNKKRWTFNMRRVPTATAQAITTSLAKTSFSFTDAYDSASYTVHCVAFSNWQPYDNTNAKWTCSMTLEVV